jgi:hypothetical protein
MDTDMDFEETLEEKLQNIENYNKVTQLHILIEEIHDILHVKVNPSAEWYEIRVGKLYEYMEIDWDELETRFQHTDEFMYTHVPQLSKALHYLTTEWNTTLQFNLYDYGTALMELNTIWMHYKEYYMGSDTILMSCDISEIMGDIEKFSF